MVRVEVEKGSLVKSDPFVSIVIPAYNSSDFILETLESVFKQTFTDYEVVIVNDGSTDTIKLEELLTPYMDRIIYIKQSNGGAAMARNNGILHSSGKLIAFLDSDDVWFPQYLEHQVKILNQNSYDLVYCDAMLFGDLKNKKFRTYMQECPSEGEVSCENLISGKINLITSGVVARREAIIKAGLFDESLTAAFPEDFDLWFRMARAGLKMGYHRAVLFKYRIRATGLTGSDLQKAKRSVKALQMISQKYDLTNRESEILKKRLKVAKVELTIQRAKIQMVKENFLRARKLLIKAYVESRRLKLGFLVLLFEISPQFILKAFQRTRPAEFASIISNLH